MKIDQLIYFTETAKLEHIGKASKVLGISTSAISHSIASLEGELGYDLFEKKGKNIVLTDLGRILLEQSENLINQFQNLKQNFLGSQKQKMHLKIAATHHLSQGVLARAWQKLQSNYPQVSVEIITLRSAEVVKAIQNREIDFGLCFSPQEHPDLTLKLAHEGELLLVVQKNHPVLKFKGLERLKKLGDFPAVLPKAYQGIEICLNHAMFDRFEIKPSPNTLTDSYDVVLELVKNSNAWGFVPDIIVKNNKSLIGLKSNQGWKAPYNISFVHQKKRFLPQFILDLENEVKKQFTLRTSGEL